MEKNHFRSFSLFICMLFVWATFFPPVHLTAASFVNYKIYAIFEQQNVNIDLRICWNAFDLFY